jgi:uncharacterized membrane protein
LCSALAAPAAGQEATVQGRVHDDEGAAVSSVIVTLQSDSALVAGTSTDRLGLFRFPPVPAGPYTVYVAGIGYAEYAQEIAVPSEGALDLDVTIVRQS